MKAIPEGYEVVSDIPEGYEVVNNPKPEFISGVKQAFDRRIKKGNEIADASISGKQSALEDYIQFGGQGLAFGGDVFFEGLKSLGRGVSNITPEFIKEPLKFGARYGLDYVGNSPVGAAASQGLDYALQKYANFEKEYPRAARNIGAATNIGLSVAPLVRVGGHSAATTAQSLAQEGLEKGLKAGVKTAKKGGRILNNTLNTTKIFPTSDEIKEAYQNLFIKGRELGATFDPILLDEVTLEGEKFLPKGNIAPDLLKPDKADNFVALLKKRKYANPTLDDFEALDKYFGNQAHATFLSDPALSRKYSILQGALRESANNPFNVIGSDEGIKTYREATRLWSIRAKMRDIERIIEAAPNYDKPDGAIKTGFRRIAGNDKLMRGYSEAERKAIRRAARTGSLEGVFKTFGSRLVAIGGASTGGLPGAIAGYTISQGGRAITEAMKKGQAGTALKLLGERSGLVRTKSRITREDFMNALKDLN